MVDLARQAFGTNNFGLAAEIYERTISENGPQAELFLGLADSFARGGQFTKAFEAYTNALRLGNGRVTPDKLKHLVTALIDCLAMDSNASGGQPSAMKKNCMFTCVLCLGLMNDPVTIKCGHTFCRKCLERDRTNTCKVCGIVHYRLKPSNIRTNVVLLNLIHKWFPDSCRAAELKAQGNKFFEKRDFERAIKFYSEAILLSTEDHLLLSNRSHAYNSLDQFDEAREDAERVIKMRPDWPKGFFRKGNALYGLGHYEDAVIAYMQCLSLDKEVAMAKEHLSKALHMVLSQHPDDPKAVQRQRDVNPSLFQALLKGNFQEASSLPPHITASTVQHLKRIMEGTMENASNFQPSTLTSSASSASLGETSSSGASRDAGSFSNHIEGSLFDKQRCVSTPSLRHGAPPSPSLDSQRQRSRSQSPDRKSPNTTGSGRKRSRKPSNNTPPPSPTRSSPHKCIRSEATGESGVPDFKEVDPSLRSVEDLECSLCYRLFHWPVTTPCGHTFCRECLDRCLDHQTSCPMCKSTLAEYLAERRSTLTESLQAIILTYFEQEHVDRQKVHEEEISELAKMGLDNQHEIPVFVCTLGFPSVLCPLHIFEPRYRLMIRQCMESGARQFGMCACLSDNEENFSDYGCMLEVRDVHFFPDGRSLVDTIGGRRFKVLGRGKRDGYNTAKVEFLSDSPVLESDMPELQTLQGEIYEDMKKWLEALPVTDKARISQHFGSLPTLDPTPGSNPVGPTWAWWCMAVLPIDTRIQLTMMAMVSLKERLEAIKRVLHYLAKKRK